MNGSGAGHWGRLPEPHPAADRGICRSVVAYDYGIKRNILRMLVDRSCRVTVVPAQTPAAEVLALAPDGVFSPIRPGRSRACDYAIEVDQTSARQRYSGFRYLSRPPVAGSG